MNTTFWIAWNRVTNQRNDCPNPCKSLQISVGGKNYLQVRICAIEPTDELLRYEYVQLQ